MSTVECETRLGHKFVPFDGGQMCCRCSTWMNNEEALAYELGFHHGQLAAIVKGGDVEPRAGNA